MQEKESEIQERKKVSLMCFDRTRWKAVSVLRLPFIFWSDHLFITSNTRAQRVFGPYRFS